MLIEKTAGIGYSAVAEGEIRGDAPYTNRAGQTAIRFHVQTDKRRKVFLQLTEAEINQLALRCQQWTARRKEADLGATPS